MASKCPDCGKLFEEVFVVHNAEDTPFACDDPLEGLNAYSAFSVPKEVICHKQRFVHIMFEDGEERLIRIAQRYR